MKDKQNEGLDLLRIIFSEDRLNNLIIPNFSWDERRALFQRLMLVTKEIKGVIERAVAHNKFNPQNNMWKRPSLSLDAMPLDVIGNIISLAPAPFYRGFYLRNLRLTSKKMCYLANMHMSRFRYKLPLSTLKRNLDRWRNERKELTSKLEGGVCVEFSPVAKVIRALANVLLFSAVIMTEMAIIDKYRPHNRKVALDDLEELDLSSLELLACLGGQWSCYYDAKFNNVTWSDIDSFFECVDSSLGCNSYGVMSLVNNSNADCSPHNVTNAMNACDELPMSFENMGIYFAGFTLLSMVSASILISFFFLYNKYLFSKQDALIAERVLTPADKYILEMFGWDEENGSYADTLKIYHQLRKLDWNGEPATYHFPKADEVHEDLVYDSEDDVDEFRSAGASSSSCEGFWGSFSRRGASTVEDMQPLLEP